MSKKIKIKSAPGTNPPQNTVGAVDLVDQGLYFEETSTPGEFYLYEPGRPVPPIQPSVIPTTPTILKTGQNFTFTWAGLFWSITNFVISITPPPHLVGTASGSWTASTPEARPDALPSGSGGNPESGTFQANDTVDVEGESSASAYA